MYFLLLAVYTLMFYLNILPRRSLFWCSERSISFPLMAWNSVLSYSYSSGYIVVRYLLWINLMNDVSSVISVAHFFVSTVIQILTCIIRIRSLTICIMYNFPDGVWENCWVVSDFIFELYESSLQRFLGFGGVFSCGFHRCMGARCYQVLWICTETWFSHYYTSQDYFFLLD